MQDILYTNSDIIKIIKKLKALSSIGTVNILNHVVKQIGQVISLIKKELYSINKKV
jgi:hypothetical protein